MRATKRNPNICKPEEIKPFLVEAFSKKNLVPLFGAGLSVGMDAQGGKVPDGKSSKKQSEIKQLENALKKANLAKSMLVQSMKKAENLGLGAERSLVHFKYTYATIQCELYRLKYTDIVESLEATIGAVYEAIISPYNTDEYKDDSSLSRGIKRFIQNLPKRMIDLQEAKSKRYTTDSTEHRNTNW